MWHSCDGGDWTSFCSSVVPGIIGNLQALEVLKLATGVGGI